MAEHRTVILTGTQTGEEHRVTAKVKDLDDETLANIDPEHVQEARVAQAAERALIAYRKEHPADYLVTGIERGVDE